MSSDRIVFKGIVFRRYPNAKRRTDQVYFTPGIADKIKGAKRLHEEIWMDAHGEIPEGHHIHHADHDPLNNSIDNLVCILAGDHHRHHSSTPERAAYLTSEKQLAHLAEIRGMAAEWHRSPEGREWHREHGFRVAAKRKSKPGECEQCGNAFVSKRPDRFCSNPCKSAWRRESGLDDETRSCELCGAEFVTNKYRKNRYCTRSCASKVNRAKQLGRVMD